MDTDDPTVGATPITVEMILPHLSERGMECVLGAVAKVQAAHEAQRAAVAEARVAELEALLAGTDSLAT